MRKDLLRLIWGASISFCFLKGFLDPWFGFVLLVNVLALALLLDKNSKDKVKRFYYAAIQASGISWIKWAWFIRSLAAVNLMLLTVTGTIFYLTEQPFYKTSFVFIMAGYIFWYLISLPDSNPPIDQRILRLFHSKAKRYS